MEIRYDIANSGSDLKAIQQLQQDNIPQSISPEELKAQGFVTARHDLSLLEKMNTPYPHVVARANQQIVGYTLVMLPAFSNSLPVLIPMFERIASLSFEGRPLDSQSWFVMGQVCIQKDFRGQGLFNGLYMELKARMSIDFNYVLTQISKRNPRSIRAHEKVGFQVVEEYWDQHANEQWVIVLWDWT